MNRIVDGCDRDLGSQLVERQAFGQGIPYIRGAFETEAGIGPPDEKIEQDLALGCQKRGGTQLARRDRRNIGCDQILEEMLGLGPLDQEAGAVGQSADGHGGILWHLVAKRRILVR